VLSSDVQAGIGGYALATTMGRPGFALAGVGDVNGDGRGDVAVTYEPAYPLPPRVFIFWGQAGTTEPLQQSEATGFEIRPANDTDRIGAYLAAAGDVNGDGLSDVLVGASLNSQGTPAPGAAYVVFGKRDALPVDLDVTPGASFAIHGDATPIAEANYGSAFGSAAIGAGDTNADGLSDLLIGDWARDSAYLVFGKRDTAPVQALELESKGQGRLLMRLPQRLNNSFGRSLSSAGDIDLDGRQDFIIGAYAARIEDSNAVGPGAAFVIFGKALLGF
jgi:hypothetical protein